jgi:hypothetical protein
VAIPAELLAALAQIEGAGNPVAHTYWRWSLTWHPLEIFRPASSAVGMYQMTDGALADAGSGRNALPLPRREDRRLRFHSELW